MISIDTRAKELSANALRVKMRIAEACAHCRRDPRSVKLVWVSKMHPISDVEAAIQAGATEFGENKVQEAQRKFNTPRPGVTLHVIGPVQSNKWTKAAKIADWIHSVDSLDALKKYQAASYDSKKTLDVLFQVNTSQEATKSGLEMKDVEAFLLSLPPFLNIRYRGLMTIGVNSGNPEDSRKGFAWLRQMRDRMQFRGGIFSQFTELSIGMTDDLEIAIAEGSTLIRVGTAIFGARDYT
jgi:pyridoxal phosphate enzyme (YggS family)